MRRMMAFIRPYYGRMAGGFAVKFFGTIGELWLP